VHLLVQNYKERKTFTLVWVRYLDLRNTVLLLYVVNLRCCFRNQSVEGCTLAEKVADFLEK
jgi:hypothetical protein